MSYDFTTKEEMLNKLRAYRVNPDDDNIRIKEKIKQALLSCPELLYSFGNKELETELFNEDGSLNEDGEWDRYFGEPSHIRDYLMIPDVQTDAKTILCYQTHFQEQPRYNAVEKYQLITFNVFVHGADVRDKNTGIAKHDLIASIVREKFNWSNIFGMHCELVSDKEGTTDKNYASRTLVFQATMPKGLVKTSGGETGYINKKSLRKGMI